MTDYQMRAMSNMMLALTDETLSDSPEKKKLLSRMIAIRDGNKDVINIDR